MTKKHFEAVAALLKFRVDEADSGTIYADAQRYTVKVIAEDLAQVFAGENPRFDRARFLKAAGVVDIK